MRAEVRSALLVLAVLPVAAHAHDLSAEYGWFAGSALHVLTEPDHFSVAFAIGLLAAQRVSLSWAAMLLGVFAAFFALGGGAPLFVGDAFGFESIDSLAAALSLVYIGLLVALPALFSPAFVIVGTGAAGFVHGLANGLAAAETGEPVVATMGAWLGALAIALAGAAVAQVNKTRWGAVAVRVLGSWAAALGLILAGLALRGGA